MVKLRRMELTIGEGNIGSPRVVYLGGQRTNEPRSMVFIALEKFIVPGITQLNK
jgi:hypothetical protein